MKSKMLPIYNIEDSKNTFFESQSQSGDYFIAEASNFKDTSSQPYRTSFYGIGMCIKGSVSLKANLFDIDIKENTLIAVNSSTIRSWHNRTDDNKMLTVFFNQDFIKTQNNSVLFLERFPFFQFNAHPTIDLSPIQSQQIERLMYEMLEIQQSSLKGKHIIIQNYIQILLQFANEYFEPNTQLQSLPFNAPTQIALNFKQAISEHFKVKRKVKDYAELLFVSPKHLAETIKTVTGKAAHDWINDMVILEAQVLLTQTDLSISQIVEKLNFADTSFFAKFFKKATRFTPIEYRKMHT
jgi:AraC family transcriptional regulator, transcriptional activator of pobA